MTTVQRQMRQSGYKDLLYIYAIFLNNKPSFFNICHILFVLSLIILVVFVISLLTLRVEFDTREYTDSVLSDFFYDTLQYLRDWHWFA